MESNQNSLERYQRTQMRKENIVEKLRERGCRITFITKQPGVTVKSEWQPFTA